MLKTIIVFLLSSGVLSLVLWNAKGILKFLKQNWKLISIIVFSIIFSLVITFI